MAGSRCVAANAASWAVYLLKNGALDTMRAPMPWRVMAAKAASKSSGLSTSTRCNVTPTAWAAASTGWDTLA